MEKTLRNSSEIAFYFFLALGTAHISASLLVAQGVVGHFDWLIFSSFDLPFLLTGLVYMTCRLSLEMGDIFGSYKIPLIILSSLSTLAFIVALYLNFILQDAVLV